VREFFGLKQDCDVVKGASIEATGCRRKHPVSATASQASISRGFAAIKTSAT